VTASRIRRLAADHEQVVAAFASHPHVSLVQVEGDPPTRYVVEYRVMGLCGIDGREPRAASAHRAEIYLPDGYPRRPPFVRMLTPVFHPNIDPRKVCVGDHWSAGQSLVQLILRVAEMVCWQSYNVKSPLNAEAAAWAERNASRLPLQAGDISAGT
jgi:ubiquitin-protein ligase